LVSIEKYEDFYNPASAELLVAGTEEDNGESWYVGCGTEYDIISTKDFTNPLPNANFYINVTGDVLIQRVQVL
jgi:hypothetical protein